MDAVPAPAPGSRRVAVAAGVAVAAVLLLPGVSRWIPGSLTDEEHLRGTLAFAALALALALPRRAGSGGTSPLWGLPALALVPLVPSVFSTASPWRPVGPLGVAAARLPSLLASCLLLWGAGVAVRRWRGSWPGVRAGLAFTGVASALWVLADRAAGSPAVGPFGRAGVA